MFRIKYPHVNPLLTEHSKMLSELDELILEFRNSGNPVSITKFISDWIVNHLNTMDMPMAQFLQEAKAKRLRSASPIQSRPKAALQQRLAT